MQSQTSPKIQSIPPYLRITIELTSLASRMKNPSLLKRTAPNRGLVNICTEKEANAYLRQIQKDGKPPFSTTLLVSINQYIHEPEETIEERFKLMEISTLFSVIADGRVSFPVPVGDMTIEQIGVLMGGQSNANVEEVSYVEA